MGLKSFTFENFLNFPLDLSQVPLFPTTSTVMKYRHLGEVR